MAQEGNFFRMYVWKVDSYTSNVRGTLLTTTPITLFARLHKKLVLEQPASIELTVEITDPSTQSLTKGAYFEIYAGKNYVTDDVVTGYMKSSTGANSLKNIQDVMANQVGQPLWASGYIQELNKSVSRQNNYELIGASAMLKLANFFGLNNMQLNFKTPNFSQTPNYSIDPISYGTVTYNGFSGVIDALNGLAADQSAEAEYWQQGILTGSGWWVKYLDGRGLQPGQLGYIDDSDKGGMNAPGYKNYSSTHPNLGPDNYYRDRAALPGFGDSWFTAWDSALINIQILSSHYNLFFREDPSSTSLNGLIHFGPLGDPATYPSNFNVVIPGKGAVSLGGTPFSVWGGDALALYQVNGYDPNARSWPTGVNKKRFNSHDAYENEISVIEYVGYQDNIKTIQNLVWGLGSGANENTVVTIAPYFPPVTDVNGNMNDGGQYTDTSGKITGQKGASYQTEQYYRPYAHNSKDSIASISVVNGGNNYTSQTKLIISSNVGGGALANPVITNGVITGVTLTSGGSGYENLATVTANDPGGGSGATFSVVVNTHNFTRKYWLLGPDETTTVIPNPSDPRQPWVCQVQASSSVNTSSNLFQLIIAQQLDGKWGYGVLNRTSADEFGIYEKVISDKKVPSSNLLLSYCVGEAEYNSQPVPTFILTVKHPRRSGNRIPVQVQPGQTIDIHYAGKVYGPLTRTANGEWEPANMSDYQYLVFPRNDHSYVEGRTGSDIGNPGGVNGIYIDNYMYDRLRRVTQVDEEWSNRTYSSVYVMGNGHYRKKHWEDTIAQQFTQHKTAPTHHTETRHLKNGTINNVKFFLEYGATHHEKTGVLQLPVGNGLQPYAINSVQYIPGGLAVSDVKDETFFDDHHSVSFTIMVGKEGSGTVSSNPADPSVGYFVDFMFAKPLRRIKDVQVAKGEQYAFFRMAWPGALMSKDPVWGNNYRTGFYIRKNHGSSGIPESLTPVGHTVGTIYNQIPTIATPHNGLKSGIPYSVTIKWTGGTYSAHITALKNFSNDVKDKGVNRLAAIWRDDSSLISDDQWGGIGWVANNVACTSISSTIPPVTISQIDVRPVHVKTAKIQNEVTSGSHPPRFEDVLYAKRGGSGPITLSITSKGAGYSIDQQVQVGRDPSDPIRSGPNGENDAYVTISTVDNNGSVLGFDIWKGGLYGVAPKVIIPPPNTGTQALAVAKISSAANMGAGHGLRHYYIDGEEYHDRLIQSTSHTGLIHGLEGLGSAVTVNRVQGASLNSDGLTINFPTTGRITAINIVSAKDTWKAAPVVSISYPPAGGIPATAIASIYTKGSNKGKLKAITMTNFGSGYTSTPSVVISGANLDKAVAVEEMTGIPPGSIKPNQVITLHDGQNTEKFTVDQIVTSSNTKTSVKFINSIIVKEPLQGTYGHDTSKTYTISWDHLESQNVTGHRVQTEWIDELGWAQTHYAPNFSGESKAGYLDKDGNFISGNVLQGTGATAGSSGTGGTGGTGTPPVPSGVNNFGVSILSSQIADVSHFAQGVEHEGDKLFTADEYYSTTQRVYCYKSALDQNPLIYSPITTTGALTSNTSDPNNPSILGGSPSTNDEVLGINGSWLSHASDGTTGQGDSILQLTATSIHPYVLWSEYSCIGRDNLSIVHPNSMSISQDVTFDFPFYIESLAQDSSMVQHGQISYLSATCTAGTNLVYVDHKVTDIYPLATVDTAGNIIDPGFQPDTTNGDKWEIDYGSLISESVRVVGIDAVNNALILADNLQNTHYSGASIYMTSHGLTPVHTVGYIGDGRKLDSVTLPIDAIYIGFVDSNGNWYKGYYTSQTTKVTDSITSINIINGGYNYGPNTTITLSPPDLPGGVQATASLYVATTSPYGITGQIMSATITNPGSGYLMPPTVTINQQSGYSGSSGYLTASMDWLPPFDYPSTKTTGVGNGSAERPRFLGTLTASNTQTGQWNSVNCKSSALGIESGTELVGVQIGLYVDPLTIGNSNISRTVFFDAHQMGYQTPLSTPPLVPGSGVVGIGTTNSYSPISSGNLASDLHVWASKASTTLSSIKILDGGTGYPPYETFDLTISPPDNPSGVQAVGSATSDGRGKISQVSINNSNSGYEELPVISVNAFSSVPARLVGQIDGPYTVHWASKNSATGGLGYINVATGNNATSTYPITPGPPADGTSNSVSLSHPNVGIPAVPYNDVKNNGFGLINITGTNNEYNSTGNYVVFNPDPTGYWVTDKGSATGVSYIPGYNIPLYGQTSYPIQTSGFAVLSSQFNWKAPPFPPTFTGGTDKNSPLSGPRTTLVLLGQLGNTPDPTTGALEVFSSGPQTAPPTGGGLGSVDPTIPAAQVHNFIYTIDSLGKSPNGSNESTFHANIPGTSTPLGSPGFGIPSGTIAFNDGTIMFRSYFNIYINHVQPGDIIVFDNGKYTGLTPGYYSWALQGTNANNITAIYTNTNNSTGQVTATQGARISSGMMYGSDGNFDLSNDSGRGIFVIGQCSINPDPFTSQMTFISNVQGGQISGQFIASGAVGKYQSSTSLPGNHVHLNITYGITNTQDGHAANSYFPLPE